MEQPNCISSLSLTLNKGAQKRGRVHALARASKGSEDPGGLNSGLESWGNTRAGGGVTGVSISWALVQRLSF